MKNVVLFFLLFSSYIYSQKVDHSLMTELMLKYNFNGNLDYEGLTTEPKLDDYLQILSKTEPEKLSSDDEKMAFWINVYNAFTIKAIVDNYPVESINDLHTGGRILGHILSTTVWDDEFIPIKDEMYSLNQVEHEILRKDFEEPRIHFAIVCASISCPVLRKEAFIPERLDSQLEEQTIGFFNDQTKNKFDSDKKITYISKILDWFSEDFGNDDEEILFYVSNYIDKKIGEDIRNNVDDWSIDYMDYDWGLNEYKTN